MLFKVIRTNSLIDRRAAVQVVDDKLPEFFFLLGDDADAALFVVVENKVVQNNAVKIGTEDAQNHGFLVVDKRGRKRHTHACQRHGSSQLHVQIFV